MKSTATKAHFVGIGGAGMSGIARVLLAMGWTVTGSDLKESRNTLQLREEGAEVFIGHAPSNVGNAGVVVISAAVAPNNCEVEAARGNGQRVVSRAEMVAELAKGKRSIAVAGTHGKTTTTSMISSVFDAAGLNPTFLIGGELNDIGSNAKYGSGEFLITEADESDGSLLKLRPELAVVTNVEADHLDYYGSVERIEETFCRFLSGLAPDGTAVVCGDHEGARGAAERCPGRVVTYGLEGDRDFSAGAVKLTGCGSEFTVKGPEGSLGRVSLSVPGIHNVYNALATIAVAVVVGVDFRRVSSALRRFSGVKRRFEVKGSATGVTLVDDYAHHPSEVKATLAAARAGDWPRVVCVFQPHRFSRTKLLGREFGWAFRAADLVVLTDVYGAGEEPEPGVTGKLILDAVLHDSPATNVAYLPKKTEILSFLRGIVEEGDLVLTMGAGDIWAVGEELLDLLKARESATAG